MSFKFFVVPVNQPERGERELNEFLASHRVLAVDRRFVDRGENSCWAFCVDYQDSIGSSELSRKKTRIDYKEVLSPEEFPSFVQLRELRTQLAQSEAVPVYTIFTNEQLAAMVQKDVRTKDDLQSIPGIGEARIAKYGEAFLEIMRAKDEKTG